MAHSYARAGSAEGATRKLALLSTQRAAGRSSEVTHGRCGTACSGTKVQPRVRRSAASEGLKDQAGRIRRRRHSPRR
eukprot:761859-Prymnesium_polylepis.2